ncbi:unnamed protein product [Acanthoscelides obtectus]|uniref:CCC domain-containing protein n=1 Tax=Acanthoscelides obtectus TaxID=200917 RepID=A0A9P0PYP0_ACAOB|nr:unnamed protein product [Acanthoscelides obtectus]CAK1659844.1 hypothetical protein AOBTE_LOCUS21705 [Acanthoscelides obtectus]
MMSIDESIVLNPWLVENIYYEPLPTSVGSLQELFPFIPHTCYFGDQLCSPIAGTCDNYYKLSICCCKKYAFLKCEYHRVHELFNSTDDN